MFWLRNKKKKISITHSYLGACCYNKTHTITKNNYSYIIPAPLLFQEISEQKSMGCMALSTVDAD